MKKLIILGLFAGLTLPVHAQSSFVISGGDMQGSGGSTSFSAGQVAYLNKTGTGGSLSEGVQQAFIPVALMVKEKDARLLVSAFPNPTSGVLQIRAENNVAELNVELSDIYGRTVIEEQMWGNLHPINLTSLATGTYYVRVSDNGLRQKIFTVIKN